MNRVFRARWRRIVLIAACVVVFLIANHFEPWRAVSPFGYYRLQLGMTESEIVAMLGVPEEKYRHSRHIGGTLSPGHEAVLHAESGLHFADMPLSNKDLARDGQKVVMKQWWGRNWTINVAFDTQGVAVGIYLMQLESVNM